MLTPNRTEALCRIEARMDELLGELSRLRLQVQALVEADAQEPEVSDTTNLLESKDDTGRPGDQRAGDPDSVYPLSQGEVVQEDAVAVDPLEATSMVPPLVRNRPTAAEGPAVAVENPDHEGEGNQGTNEAAEAAEVVFAAGNENLEPNLVDVTDNESTGSSSTDQSDPSSSEPHPVPDRMPIMVNGRPFQPRHIYRSSLVHRNGGIQGIGYGYSINKKTGEMSYTTRSGRRYLMRDANGNEVRSPGRCENCYEFHFRYFCPYARGNDTL